MSLLLLLFPCPVNSYPFVYTTTTVTTDDLEEFIEPVYDQVHQEQIAASEMPENIADIPVVYEQVIVQEIPDVIVPLPPADEFSAPVYDQVHQEQIAASEMTVDFAEIAVVHEQVIAGDAAGAVGGRSGAAGGAGACGLPAL